jgi:hypothetical protein
MGRPGRFDGPLSVLGPSLAQCGQEVAVFVRSRDLDLRIGDDSPARDDQRDLDTIRRLPGQLGLKFTAFG